jgi:hypothetical protein
MKLKAVGFIKKNENRDYNITSKIMIEKRKQTA